MPAVALIGAIVLGALAVTEAVQLEVIKTVGIALALLGSIVSAHYARTARDEQRRRRHEVRDPSRERRIVLEHPPDGKPGAHRRASDKGE